MSNKMNNTGTLFITSKYNNKMHWGNMRLMEFTLFENLEKQLEQWVKDIVLTGDDPSEYYGLCDLITYLKKIRGVERVSVHTHGKPYADLLTAKELVDAGVDAVTIPIYGATAEIHERTTRCEGSFDLALHALGNFKKLGVDVSVTTTISKYNQNDLTNIYNLIRPAFAPAKNCSFELPTIVVNDRLSKEEIETRINSLLSLTEVAVVLGKFIENIRSGNLPLPMFNEIPYCVFGSLHSGGALGSGGSVHENVLFSKRQNNSSSFNATIKPERLCMHCTAKDKCNGINQKYFDMFGIAGLEPVK